MSEQVHFPQDASQALHFHPFEEQDPYGTNQGDNSGAPVNPIKRLRWATRREKPSEGIKKRQSILRRFQHGRSGSGGKSAQSDNGSDDASDQDAKASHGQKRTIYFNRVLPPEALDEDGRPIAHYPRNKIRTSKYTPLSFIPKNLWFQFHNIANIYFLFIIILGAFSIFSNTNPGLNATPLIVIVAITAIKDAIEDFRRTILDGELNNSPVHRLVDWENVNSSSDRVGPWRKFKKACTRGILWIWRSFQSIQNRRKAKKEVEELGPIEAYAERATGMGAHDGHRRFSNYSERFGDDAVEMTPVATPRASHDIKRFDSGDKSGMAFNDRLAVPSPNEKAEMSNGHQQRNYGNLIDNTMDVPGKARFKKDYWKNVQVGDFVRLYTDEPVPADIVILATADPDGACYIETKNLDGETNLKVRQAVRAGQRIKRARDCEKCDFIIESEAANPNLYSYNGAVRWTEKDPRDSTKTIEMAEPLSIGNLLLRGCNIRNTEWVLGVVVFTGQETKIMLNSGVTPSKRAKISRDLNWNVIYNFIILFFMCLIAALVNGTYWGRSNTSRVFFEFGAYGSTPALNGFITFWAAVILFQNLVPISLYISLEIVRTFQAFFIYSDHFMYYAPVDYPCTPKTWNICDDLGQIEYIFSDKTGTLTQNVMEFKKATIGGVPYGEAYTEAQAGMRKRQGVDVEAEAAAAREQIANDKEIMLTDLRRMHDNPYLLDENLTFIAPDFVADLRGDNGPQQSAANEEFMVALALCHSVVAERTPGNPPKIEFKAQSPDEAALVATARDCGFTVIGKAGDTLMVNVMGEERHYNIMNTLEFNSTRKRMSAIVRMPDGKIVLFCKGADSIIYSRLRTGEQKQLRGETADHLEMFAREGLRTLCIAKKEISEEDYKIWSRQHDVAAAAVDDRDEKLEEVSDAIERDLMLLGGTAIEDRLQDGVPDAISLLGTAGIKLWVLTGDKVETAINIGFSCNLLNNDMDLILVKPAQDTLEAAEQLLNEKLATFGLSGSDEELVAAKKDHAPPAPTHGLVIDGDALKLVLDDALRQKFLLLCKQCKSVLCCRVSPAQKAAVVKMVKRGLDVITLSIGDGANDVAMIQEADVGVGIVGEEGRQAAMSSDFAIGQFRFLARLVLIHGRWCYRRMAECIANFFYKNIVWTFAIFWYNIYDSFDCVQVYNYTYILLFNLAFTSLPVIFLGILDQDVSDKVSLAVPQLYRRGIERLEWTPLKFWLYMFDGLYQSIICFFMAYLIFAPGTFSTEGGRTVNDTQRMGVYISNATVAVVNIYVLMNTYRWDVATVGITAFSILLIWAWTGIYTSFEASFQFYKAATEVYGNLTFWAQTFLTIVVALLPRFAVKAYQKMYVPLDVDIIREQVRQGKFKYLDDADPELIKGADAAAAKHKSVMTSSSESSDAKVRHSDERPIYPPSLAPTATTGTRNPHSAQNSDDTTAVPLPSGKAVAEIEIRPATGEPQSPATFLGRSSADGRPRQSFDRVRPTYDRANSSFDRQRPSFDRMRSSMDRTRASFEVSNDFTSAAMLRRMESGGPPSPLGGPQPRPRPNRPDNASRSRSQLRSSSVYED